MDSSLNQGKSGQQGSKEDRSLYDQIQSAIHSKQLEPSSYTEFWNKISPKTGNKPYNDKVCDYFLHLFVRLVKNYSQKNYSNVSYLGTVIQLFPLVQQIRQQKIFHLAFLAMPLKPYHQQLLGSLYHLQPTVPVP